MVPEITLVAVLLVSLFFLRMTRGRYEIALAARIAMASMLVVTALGHFMFTKGMTMMLPEFIPYRTGLIYLTGVIELSAAVGLCLPRYKVVTGWWLIAFYILILPSNIYAAALHVDIEKATFDGPGLNYLWFRIPLQALFIVWTYLSTIKASKMQQRRHRMDTVLDGSDSVKTTKQNGDVKRYESRVEAIE